MTGKNGFVPGSSAATESGFVSVADAAARLDIARTTAYGLINSGVFPVRVVRVGGSWKVDRAQLEAFIAGDPALGEGPAAGV